MNSSVDFAILAPVPDEHLVSGSDVLANEGFVAFGSLKWELFPEIDQLRGDKPVPMLIYPSYEHEAAKISYVIKWTGWYVGHVRSVAGAHPDGMRYRPETAKNYPNDLSGYWAIFWHVAELQKLPEAKHKSIASLHSYKTAKFWKAGHAPRGPEIVARPSWI